MHLGEREREGLRAAEGVPHVAHVVDAFTFQPANASWRNFYVIATYVAFACLLFRLTMT